jgi:hypothetical protein
MERIAPIPIRPITGWRARGRYAAVLAVVVPAGFLTKLYDGPGSAIVTGHLGGFFYVVFWVFCALAVRPGLRPAPVAAAALAGTAGVELLQLWHPPCLERVRASFLGHALLGSTFSGSDFPWYAAGALAAWALARRLQATRRNGPSTS